MITAIKSIPMEHLSGLIEEFIKNGTDVTITVTGNSMWPMLADMRDSVVLTKCDPEKIRKYDLPLYRRNNGQYILHRIVKVNKNTCNMLGDHQTKIEENVPKSNIICVVKAFTRKSKYHSCNSKWYKLYACVWTFLRPLRPFIFNTYRFLAKFFNK